MAFKQYDPEKVSVVIGTTPMRAFADGSMVAIEYTVDKRSLHIGTDGNGRHIKSADSSGMVTVRLASYSPSNAALIALDLLDEPFPITVTDKSSSADLFFAESCTVRRIPNMEKSNVETPNEWIFQFVRGNIEHTGAEI
ncbi:DUF3277 family protein [candidate division KSB1 bacterium]|nr:DUF3277 family protein [candidate division KSB1 bacterium]